MNNTNNDTITFGMNGILLGLLVDWANKHHVTIASAIDLALVTFLHDKCNLKISTARLMVDNETSGLLEEEQD